MTRVMARVQYLGENYCGFQVQPNGITVQEVLESALSQLLNENIKVIASGRTDAGVHALGQVIHFDMNGNFPIERIPYAIARLLPCDISIIQAEAVNANFHARYSAKKKKYGYKIYFSNINSPFMAKRAYLCPYDIDMDVLSKAAKNLIGKHDFKAFMSTGSCVENTIRTIYCLDIILINNGKILQKHSLSNNYDNAVIENSLRENECINNDNLIVKHNVVNCESFIDNKHYFIKTNGAVEVISDHAQLAENNHNQSNTQYESGYNQQGIAHNNLQSINVNQCNSDLGERLDGFRYSKMISQDTVLEIYLTGNGFLYNMVRIIVGTLLDIARGRLPVDTITKMLTTGDRSIGGATAPSCGLYLVDVEYNSGNNSN